MKYLLFILMIGLLISNVSFSQTSGAWKTVYSFSGSSNENTDDFVIKSNKWRIVWVAKKQYEELDGGNVFIKLVDSNGEEDMIANVIPNDSGKTIIRKKGKFFFDVSCVLAKWKIEVQEYVSK
jgi:hypothetical protein